MPKLAINSVQSPRMPMKAFLMSWPFKRANKIWRGVYLGITRYSSNFSNSQKTLVGMGLPTFRRVPLLACPAVQITKKICHLIQSSITNWVGHFPKQGRRYGLLGK